MLSPCITLPGQLLDLMSISIAAIPHAASIMASTTPVSYELPIYQTQGISTASGELESSQSLPCIKDV